MRQTRELIRVRIMRTGKKNLGGRTTAVFLSSVLPELLPSSLEQVTAESNFHCNEHEMPQVQNDKMVLQTSDERLFVEDH